MARINIEDTLFEDQRFFDLSLKLGSREAAIGSLVLAWRIAQKFFVTSDRYIPLEEWSKQKLKNEIIDVGLATASDRFISLAGVEKQFGWLTQRVEAGKKGGEKRGENLRKRQATATIRLAEPSLLPPSSLLFKDINNNTAILTEDALEAIYQRYPRKLGKSAGMKRLRQTVKTPAQLDSLSLALDNFLWHHKTERTKIGFYPYFSTFTSSWQDWIKIETTTLNENTLDFSGIDFGEDND